MQEHQGVVTRSNAKQLKSHKDQIEQEKFQGLNFDVQDFTGKFPKLLLNVLNCMLDLLWGFPNAMRKSRDHDDTHFMIEFIDPFISTHVEEFVQEDSLVIALQ
ncbi:hypothetical protein M9H77_29437 [Catharanthus roseus]|uniref:Uncharacterized protein n=1 Tax=Catharanthus roseus TaxID=4058 RepID=A0ACB9ZW99_CATRO|nr:hypothetical protein M9H77_29437 [Catharanthus roseus]